MNAKPTAVSPPAGQPLQRLRPWVVLLLAAGLAWHLGQARATETEPRDVPVTRGKVDLGLQPPRGAEPKADPHAPPPNSVRALARQQAEQQQAHPPAQAPAAAAHAPAHAPTPAPAAAHAPAHPPAPAKRNPADDKMGALAERLATVMADAHAKTKAQAPKPPPRVATPAEIAAARAAALGLAPHERVVASSRDELKARAAALAGHGDSGHHGEAHWSYDGETGPVNWAKLKPEFNVCAIGKRQSPIAIDEAATLQGPAEPLQFDYRATGGSVVNNGHTIQVDLAPDNHLTVRGGNYQLLQFHFHHPSEERVNGKAFSMVAHLVHRNTDGQLAVVAVLLTPGAANPVIDTVWTHMPLDAGDRVRLPGTPLNLNELLPKDQRYYQFMGSLTTPPCTEGVLWMVLKTPVTLSPAQIRLFSQLFPNNARPVQPVNGRPVRDAL